MLILIFKVGYLRIFKDFVGFHALEVRTCQESHSLVEKWCPSLPLSLSAQFLAENIEENVPNLMESQKSASFHCPQILNPKMIGKLIKKPNRNTENYK